MSFPAGTRLSRYEIRSPIGAGGMGEVYLAEDTRLRRDVVLKILPAEVVSNRERLLRFEQEARATSSLNHPNIITIFEIGEERGIHFIVTEFIKGDSLRQFIGARPIELSEILNIALQLASALAAAHEAEIVHRDIKPENIMVRHDRIVKVLDFGLAKLANKSKERVLVDSKAETDARVMTTPGVVMGTVLYMSPEQARGLPVDARTDIWSLGVVLYEMLAHRWPFEGETPSDVIASILKTEPPALTSFVPGVPAELERIVMKALRKKKEERYQTIDELALDLKSFKQRMEFVAELERSLSPEESRGETGKQGERSAAALSAATIIETTSLFSKERHPNNLSEELTPLAGREAETAAIVRLLGRDDVRLMTLTGVGGTGKTRLAAHVAREMIQEFEDGVFFIDLAPVRDPSLVASSIAQPLGVQEAGGKSLAEALKDFLRERRMLLVLDNFEQVTPAARLVKELLSATQRSKILVTSRVPLHLQAEREFNVPPLEFPAVQELPATDELMQYAAIALFVERAQSVKPAFALTDDNAKAVTEICTRLDGLPLAIELAAARIKILSAQAILTRLENRLKLLTGGASDLPARQQTMRSAISWSYDLLTEDEKRLFRRLAVFAGGFGFEAAASVVGAEIESDEQSEAGGHQPASDVLDGITSLVDKSLLVQKEQADGEPRLRMLEVVREYALDALAASGEAEILRRNHAAYFVALGEEAEPHLQASQSAEWLDRLEEEHDNLRAALQWSLEHDEEKAARLAGAVRSFWSRHSHLTEGSRWLKAALERSPDSPPAVRFKLLGGLGLSARNQGDNETARKAYEEGLALGRAVNDLRQVALSSRGLGMVAHRQGDFTTARKFFEEGLAISRELNDTFGIAASLNFLGDLTRTEGNYAEAHPLFEESLAICRQLGNKEAVSSNLNNLGAVNYIAGDFVAARAHFAEALTTAHELGHKIQTSFSLDGFAALALKRGDVERAALLAGATQRLRESISYEIEPAERRFRDDYLQALRAALSEKEFAAAYEQGRALKTREAMALALEEPANG